MGGKKSKELTLEHNESPYKDISPKNEDTVQTGKSTSKMRSFQSSYNDTDSYHMLQNTDIMYANQKESESPILAKNRKIYDMEPQVTAPASFQNGTPHLDTIRKKYVRNVEVNITQEDQTPPRGSVLGLKGFADMFSIEISNRDKNIEKDQEINASLNKSFIHTTTGNISHSETAINNNYPNANVFKNTNLQRYYKPEMSSPINENTLYPESSTKLTNLPFNERRPKNVKRYMRTKVLGPPKDNINKLKSGLDLLQQTSKPQQERFIDPVNTVNTNTQNKINNLFITQPRPDLEQTNKQIRHTQATHHPIRNMRNAPKFPDDDTFSSQQWKAEINQVPNTNEPSKVILNSSMNKHTQYNISPKLNYESISNDKVGYNAGTSHRWTRSPSSVNLSSVHGNHLIYGENREYYQHRSNNLNTYVDSTTSNHVYVKPPDNNIRLNRVPKIHRQQNMNSEAKSFTNERKYIPQRNNENYRKHYSDNVGSVDNFHNYQQFNNPSDFGQYDRRYLSPILPQSPPQSYESPKQPHTLSSNSRMESPLVNPIGHRRFPYPYEYAADNHYHSPVRIVPEYNNGLKATDMSEYELNPPQQQQYEYSGWAGYNWPTTRKVSRKVSDDEKENMRVYTKPSSAHRRKYRSDFIRPPINLNPKDEQEFKPE